MYLDQLNHIILHTCLPTTVWYFRQIYYVQFSRLSSNHIDIVIITLPKPSSLPYIQYSCLPSALFIPRFPFWATQPEKKKEKNQARLINQVHLAICSWRPSSKSPASFSLYNSESMQEPFMYRPTSAFIHCANSRMSWLQKCFAYADSHAARTFFISRTCFFSSTSIFLPFSTSSICATTFSKLDFAPFS